MNTQAWLANAVERHERASTAVRENIRSEVRKRCSREGLDVPSWAIKRISTAGSAPPHLQPVEKKTRCAPSSPKARASHNYPNPWRHAAQPVGPAAVPVSLPPELSRWRERTPGATAVVIGQRGVELHTFGAEVQRFPNVEAALAAIGT